MENTNTSSTLQYQGSQSQALQCQSLQCFNITKKYKEKEVLHQIDLTLESGKIYGLIGRNGAGKTTLLSILSAQCPATSGDITLGEEPVWENQKALSHICFSRELNPTAESALASMKVKDYLKAASIYYPHWDKEMAEHLVKTFELEPSKKLLKLSKGMLSMLTIILALASKADYTLLDEPVAGLDVFMRDKFYKLLLEEYDKTGRTFLISTHIIDEASPIFEDVVILKDGAILLKENTEELLSRAFHISGREDAVDAAVRGLKTYRPEKVGRSKGVTALLEHGQKLDSADGLSIQPVSLQNLFIALCGDEN